MIKLFCLGKHKAFVNIPVSVISACVLGVITYSISFGHSVYSHFVNKVSSVRIAGQILANESDRIRALGYDDIVKIEKKASDDVSGYSYEVVLGKEYREDLGNTVMKHKPVTVNIYGSDGIVPLASYSTEKVSRWYKSGSFDTSNMGIYDETGESHSGTIKRTGNGTGYVFLKKGSKLNGNVEIYDETNGDIYIYSAIGNASGDTVIRHVGPSTSSGYIRLSESSSVSGTITFENSSNGGMIIENVLKNGTSIAKKGNGTGYLMLSKGSSTNGNIQVYNESSGGIIVNGTLVDGCILRRTGDSDSLLTINGTIRGEVTINMEKSGKVVMNGNFYNGTVINYSSSTNKALTLTGTNISGNVKLVNNSYGALKIGGTMKDGCEFFSIGSGKGYVLMNGVVEGKATVQNDTNGYVSIYTVFHDGKIIKKTGGGTGYLNFSSDVNIIGDFTLYNDGSGKTNFYGGRNYTTNVDKYPDIADGAYIKVIGGNYGGVQFIYGCDILGQVNLDFTKQPSKYIYWGTEGSSSNPGSKVVLQDGYTYTAPSL